MCDDTKCALNYKSIKLLYLLYLENSGGLGCALMEKWIVGNATS